MLLHNWFTTDGVVLPSCGCLDGWPQLYTTSVAQQRRFAALGVDVPPFPAMSSCLLRSVVVAASQSAQTLLCISTPSCGCVSISRLHHRVSCCFHSYVSQWHCPQCLQLLSCCVERRLARVQYRCCRVHSAVLMACDEGCRRQLSVCCLVLSSQRHPAVAWALFDLVFKRDLCGVSRRAWPARCRSFFKFHVVRRSLLAWPAGT
jgi:hypothetical protein